MTDIVTYYTELMFKVDYSINGLAYLEKMGDSNNEYLTSM